MFTFTIRLLAYIAAKYHDMRGSKYDSKSKKYAYHYQLAMNYINITQALKYKYTLKEKLFK